MFNLQAFDYYHNISNGVLDVREVEDLEPFIETVKDSVTNALRIDSGCRKVDVGLHANLRLLWNILRVSLREQVLVYDQVEIIFYNVEEGETLERIGIKSFMCGTRIVRILESACNAEIIDSNVSKDLPISSDRIFLWDSQESEKKLKKLEANNDSTGIIIEDVETEMALAVRFFKNSPFYIIKDCLESYFKLFKTRVSWDYSEIKGSRPFMRIAQSLKYENDPIIESVLNLRAWELVKSLHLVFESIGIGDKKELALYFEDFDRDFKNTINSFYNVDKLSWAAVFNDDVDFWT